MVSCWQGIAWILLLATFVGPDVQAQTEVDDYAEEAILPEIFIRENTTWNTSREIQQSIVARQVTSVLSLEPAVVPDGKIPSPTSTLKEEEEVSSSTKQPSPQPTTVEDTPSVLSPSTAQPPAPIAREESPFLVEEAEEAGIQGNAALEGARRLGSPSFTVTIDIMTVTLVASAAFYVVCCQLARHKLKLVHELQPQMTTKKLLILSVLLVSVLRIMTILGVAAMNMANVRAHYSLQPSQHRGDKTQDFYDEAMTVLFDLPNCIVVSTYVLLTLVWAECFLEARFHTENAAYWKRRLLIGFMIFNTLLYAVCTYERIGYRVSYVSFAAFFHPSFPSSPFTQRHN